MLATEQWIGTDRRDVDRPVDGILEAIGRTPLVRLSNFLDRTDIELYAKLEYLNPGGSMKDRPAAQMLRQALADGDIDQNSVIIESSSGNTAIGLAQFCAVHSLRLRCVVDSRTQSQNLSILRAYGAEIDVVTEPDPTTGDFLQARLARIQHLLRTIPNAYWPNQYANTNNPRSHQDGTMFEIDRALDGNIDKLFVATSSTGTASGCADYIGQRRLSTKVVAVDAVGSVLFGGCRAVRQIPGLGAGIVPELAQNRVFDQVERVSDLACVAGCRRLVRTEGILAGGSAGGVLQIIRALSPTIEAGSRIVAVLADSGTRYLDTVYSDDWVHQHLEATPEQLNDLIFDQRIA